MIHLLMDLHHKTMSIILLLFLFSLSEGRSSPEDSSITLYEPDDHVIQLTDDNVTSIFDSDDIWFVEFYAHWCGHCQRFVPRWKRVGEMFENWNGTVRIAAINCATENCNAFDIIGTPTVRGFFPHSPNGTVGEDIRSTRLEANVMNFIERVQAKGEGRDATPILLPYTFNNAEAELKKLAPGMKVAFVFEDDSDFGRQLITRVGIIDDLHLRRVGQSNTFMAMAYELSSLPAIVLLDPEKPESVKYFFPTYGTLESMLAQTVDFLENHDKHGFHVPSTFELTTKASETLLSVNAKVIPDKVYAEDLEHALQYALTTEIPLQAVLDERNMNTIYQFLEVTSKYLPLKPNTVAFLRSLREWPIRMSLNSMTGDQFKAKVEELMEEYKPFGRDLKWQACRGSKQHYRGYPCGLWTLFHTTMVNAALRGDPAFEQNGTSSVARAMINYIHDFFSCRQCAANFAEKVESIGELPKTGNDSILWLWQIHNRANTLLKGDITEDPEHPKIIWPDPRNCPNCRGQLLEQFALIDGVFWNRDILTDYIINVYREENIQKRARSGKSEAHDAEYILELKLRKLFPKSSDSLFDQLLFTVNNYCVELKQNETEQH